MEIRNNFHILLVEDSETDQRLFLSSLKEVDCQIEWAPDGQVATDYLFRRGAYSESPRPDLVILDLNLPFKTGFEVLQEARANDATKNIPIVVFSTSSHQRDIGRSYELGANAYVVKPEELELFQSISRNAVSFWSRVVKSA